MHINDINELQTGTLLLINKPIGWSSFDVIRRLRNVTGVKKIGHAGTLDPLATGLLILCTGKMTKEINTFVAAEKEYTGTFTIGAVTNTYDLESEPTDFKPVDEITLDKVKEVAAEFTGEQAQRPPAFSAVKQQGKPAYLLARRGEEVELKERKITIKEFEINEFFSPIISFRVVCTTGTYIRSLANDFGIALRSGAYLSSLCRTRIGEYSLDQSESPDQFGKRLKESGYIKTDNRSQS